MRKELLVELGGWGSQVLKLALALRVDPPSEHETGRVVAKPTHVMARMLLHATKDLEELREILKVSGLDSQVLCRQVCCGRALQLQRWDP